MYVKCVYPVVPSIRILHTFATYSKALFDYPVVPGIRSERVKTVVLKLFLSRTTK